MTGRDPEHAQTRAISLVGAVLIFLLGPVAAWAGTLEYAVKAAYLFKFTPFVEWPATTFATPSSPFLVCVYGADPFGADLDQALGGRSVGEHPVRVRRLQGSDGLNQCQILYVAGSRAMATAVFSKVRGDPVLTVTEQNLGASGGVVQFVVKGGHVRFSIDSAAAAVNRVSISAKLLSLAAAFQVGS